MFYAGGRSKLASLRNHVGARKRLTAVVVAVLVSFAGMAPAVAASAPTLSLSQWNDVVFVSGSGFPGNTVVTTTATFNGKAGRASVRTWRTGQYLLGFRLPANPTGTLEVTATGGGKTAKASKTFGSSSFEPAPAPTTTPPTTAAPSTTVPPTTAAPRPTTTMPATPAPTTPAPTSNAMPQGPGGSWRMVFNDEFNSSLDRAVWPDCHWATRPGCTGQNSDELQAFKPANVSVSNGTAKLVAKKENTYVAEQSKTFNYSGAVLATGPWGNEASTFEFKYGYVESRMKTAPGKGLWSSLWLEPSSLSWPPEIDIMEAPNFSHNEIMTNLHYGTIQNHRQTSEKFRGPDFTKDFHTFGLEWTSTSLSWYVDGKKIRTLNDPNIVPKVSMYLIMQLNVGGWAGTPDNSAFPATFEVDYIRVWQR